MFRIASARLATPKRASRGCAPQEITLRRLKTILVMETAENRSGGDTVPMRKPMTG
jgi:hypothetical protein